MGLGIWLFVVQFVLTVLVMSTTMRAESTGKTFDKGLSLVFGVLSLVNFAVAAIV
jgi:hypothetical protein